MVALSGNGLSRNWKKLISCLQDILKEFNLVWGIKGHIVTCSKFGHFCFMSPRFCIDYPEVVVFDPFFWPKQMNI